MTTTVERPTLAPLLADLFKDPRGALGDGTALYGTPQSWDVCSFSALLEDIELLCAFDAHFCDKWRQQSHPAPLHLLDLTGFYKEEVQTLAFRPVETSVRDGLQRMIRQQVNEAAANFAVSLVVADKRRSLNLLASAVLTFCNSQIISIGQQLKPTDPLFLRRALPFVEEGRYHQPAEKLAWPEDLSVEEVIRAVEGVVGSEVPRHLMG